MLRLSKFLVFGSLLTILFSQAAFQNMALAQSGTIDQLSDGDYFYRENSINSRNRYLVFHKDVNLLTGLSYVPRSDAVYCFQGVIQQSTLTNVKNASYVETGIGRVNSWQWKFSDGKPLTLSNFTRLDFAEINRAGFNASASFQNCLKVMSKSQITKSSPLNNSVTNLGKYFQVSRGQLTFDAEGQECPDKTAKCYKYHSRKPHVPSSKSGVTIGRGYDMKERTVGDIISDLQSIGLSKAEAELYSKSSGLEGKNAEDFITNNKDILVEITPEQQKKLFEIAYSTMENSVIGVCIKKDTVAKYGEVDWEKLDNKIKAVLIDLRFRGDYKTKTRELIQKHVANNDLSVFKEIMNSKDWTEKYGVPKDRANRRIQCLNDLKKC